MNKLRLGVNIDHVATLRNARFEGYPNVIKVAQFAEQAGADLITAHLREDRRHITDKDIYDLKSQLIKPLNMELALNSEIINLALEIKPYIVCIVPERREEVTTEGGIDVLANYDKLNKVIKLFHAKEIGVSLFIDASEKQIAAAKSLEVKAIEIHTGTYANSFIKSSTISSSTRKELEKIQTCAKLAHDLKIEVHAGHGLNYENVQDIAKISEICELNIGHFLISQAIFIGLEASIKKMLAIIKEIRG